MNEKKIESKNRIVLTTIVRNIALIDEDTDLSTFVHMYVCSTDICRKIFSNGCKTSACH